MLQSTISRLKDEGHSEVIGTIGVQGHQLVLNPPDDSTLRRISSTPILAGTSKETQPSDAENFVRNLCFYYNGAYLRASDAMDNEEQL
jgi:hypothetical protein